VHLRMFASSTSYSILTRCDACRCAGLFFFVLFSDWVNKPCSQVHHILAEIIQGGIVLETNLDEIDSSCKSSLSWVTPFLLCSFAGRHFIHGLRLAGLGITQ